LPFRVESGQFQIFQNIGLEILFGDLGQILCRDDLVSVDVIAVKKEDGPPNVFIYDISLKK